MNIKTVTLISLLALLTGCSSTFKYTPDANAYRNKPMVVSAVEVELNLESAKQPAGYMTETEMADALRADIIRLLQENTAIQYDENAQDGLKTVVKMSYLRKFSYGDAIAKPVFSGSVQVDSASGRLATHYIGKSTTKYGGFTDAMVNAEVAVGKWDHEDEPRDIGVIAFIVVDALEDF